MTPEDEQTEPWQRNMWIVWAGIFVMNAGFSLIMPFLPLYVSSMQVTGAAVELWTGAIFSATFITGSIFLPVWGAMADRYGRRAMMIRAGIGLGIVVSLMGLATAPWQLLLLRLLQGTTVGFMPAAFAYMTTITPKEKTGYMLGMLQTANTAGTIIGPLIGGVLAAFMGYAHIFFVTGGACLVSGSIAVLFLKERVKPVPPKERGRLRDDLATVGRNPVLLAMMVVVLVQQVSVFNSEPIIPLFLQTLHTPATYLAFLSGLVFSIVGVADMIASPFLGRRGDVIGYKKVLLICLTGVGIMYALQGAAQTWWQLLIFRFGQGCFVGGVLASANSLISLSAPRSFQGRAFGVATSAMQIGNFLGPLMGGGLAAALGYRAVFPITALLCFLNLIWVWRIVPDRRAPSPVELPAD